MREGQTIAMSERVAVLRSLSALLAAGIDVQRAFAIAAREAPAARRQLEASDDARMTPVERLLAAGLLTTRERPLLEALSETGRLDSALEMLAERLDQQRRAIEKIHSGLALPGAILLIAFLVVPLPALFRNDIGMIAYVWGVIQPLALIGLIVYLVNRHWRTLLDYWTDARLLQGRLPGLMHRQGLCRDLGNLLSAGVDAARALSLLANFHSGEWSRRLKQAAQATAGGRPLVPTLREKGLLGEFGDAELLASGEESGRTAELFSHRARQLAQEQSLQLAMIAEWLPRMIYFLVLIYVALGFF